MKTMLHATLASGVRRQKREAHIGFVAYLVPGLSRLNLTCSPVGTVHAIWIFLLRKANLSAQLAKRDRR